MSSTAKARLQKLFEDLDRIFAGAHPGDVPDMVEALRKDLALRKAGASRPCYDRHTAAADGVKS